MQVQYLVTITADSVHQVSKLMERFQHITNDHEILGVKAEFSQMPPGLTTVYTDGGCDLKKNVGAWAFRVEGVTVVEKFCAHTDTTNNRMEMLAVIRALEHLEIGVPIRIVSDSEYVIKGATVWVHGWIKRGWVTSGGLPVKNQDLWEHLHKLLSLHSVVFKHVKGHTGNPGNERVDELCTLAMCNALATKFAGVSPDKHAA